MVHRSIYRAVRNTPGLWGDVTRVAWACAMLLTLGVAELFCTVATARFIVVIIKTATLTKMFLSGTTRRIILEICMGSRYKFRQVRWCVSAVPVMWLWCGAVSWWLVHRSEASIILVRLVADGATFTQTLVISCYLIVVTGHINSLLCTSILDSFVEKIYSSEIKHCFWESLFSLALSITPLSCMWCKCLSYHSTCVLSCTKYFPWPQRLISHIIPLFPND